ncbi:type I-U CRISPR-associated protein Csb2 [Pseudonocardia sp. MH-G8]|uniref:type I-G CRISPR-associated protein Csb2 n=1 Tax=Pseudonocardia sp. MH-G8 TaxID=1854588 RepID=UPI0018E95CB6|nr:type I-U CRISPR-associated protein Csb2 [Pseudonocardia sp. MH-G8]
MPFSLVATMLLNTYKGHRPDGTAEPFPSVARLHAALLAAAGFGTRAVERGGDVGPCAEDVAALRWLEDNPPSQVSIPALSASRGTAIAYRADGTIVTRIMTLTVDDIVIDDDGSMVLQLGNPPAPVPEPFATLVMQLLAQRPTDATSRWLFAGRRPDNRSTTSASARACAISDCRYGSHASPPYGSSHCRRPPR